MKRQYKSIMTHDIDFVTKFKSIRNVFSAFYRGENSLSDGYQQLQRSKKDRTTDPYWTMEQMFELDQQYGIQSRFYFMTDVTNAQYDWNDYRITDKDIATTIKRLHEQGAEIGIHFSSETQDNPQQMQKEKQQLEEVLGQTVVHSRQHFLRYQYPQTFEHLASLGIQVDSSIGPNRTIEIKGDQPYTYEMTYDDGSPIGVKQQPFLMMETHLLHQPEYMLHQLSTKVEEIKQQEGEAVVIWHNNNFETRAQKDLYRKVLQILQP